MKAVGSNLTLWAGEAQLRGAGGAGKVGVERKARADALRTAVDDGHQERQRHTGEVVGGGGGGEEHQLEAWRREGGGGAWCDRLASRIHIINPPKEIAYLAATSTPTDNEASEILHMWLEEARTFECVERWEGPRKANRMFPVPENVFTQARGHCLCLPLTP